MEHLKDTTITITIPGEWEEYLDRELLRNPSLMNQDYYPYYYSKVRALALAAWHEAQQPSHTLEAGDVVLRWAGGKLTSAEHRVSAVDEFYALVKPGYTQVTEVPETKENLDGALVRTKDGREVIAHWPEAAS